MTAPPRLVVISYAEVIGELLADLATTGIEPSPVRRPREKRDASAGEGSSR